MFEDSDTRKNSGRLPFEKTVTINEKAEILMDLPAYTLDIKAVEDFANEHNLLTKQEFHVTLVGGKASLKILETMAKLPENERVTLQEKIEELYTSIDWDLMFSDIFYYLKRPYNDPDPTDSSKTIHEIRETIIQLINVSQLPEFYAKLNELLNSDEPIQSLPHITLYSNSTRDDKKQRGIGIYSDADLNLSNAKKISVSV